MSVHDKPKIPQHIHFEDEIVEARNVREGRPPYKDVHGTDVVVDGEISLAETIVGWSRGWIAEQLVNVDPACVLQDNPEASHGKYLKLPYDAAPILEPFDTPEILGDIGGEFYAIFAMKVDSNASSSTLCRLRVRANGVVRGYYDLKPSDFPASNVVHHFAVRGRFKGNDTNKHIDIYNFKSITGAHLHVDYIGIVPTSVPMGYADVTVQTEYPAGIAETVDPSSVGDWVDPSASGSEVDTGAVGDHVTPSSTGDYVDPLASGSLVDPASIGGYTTPPSTGDHVDPATEAGYVDPAASGSSVNPAAVGDSNVTGATVGTGWTSFDYLLATGMGSSKTVTDYGDVTLKSGLCPVYPIGVSGAYISFQIIRYSGSGNVRIKLTMDGVTMETRSVYFDGSLNVYTFGHYGAYVMNNITVAVVAKAESGASLSLAASIDVWQALGHSHGIVGDSHPHSISGDQHTTPIVNDGHNTPIFNDGHSTPISNTGHTTEIFYDAHTTPIIDDGHSTPISNTGHDTPISGDEHTTPIVNDGHDTPISGDAHPHPIEGDEHDHESTEDGHEH